MRISFLCGVRFNFRLFTHCSRHFSGRQPILWLYFRPGATIPSLRRTAHSTISTWFLEFIVICRTCTTSWWVDQIPCCIGLGLVEPMRLQGRMVSPVTVEPIQPRGRIIPLSHTAALGWTLPLKRPSLFWSVAQPDQGSFWDKNPFSFGICDRARYLILGAVDLTRLWVLPTERGSGFTQSRQLAISFSLVLMGIILFFW